MSNYATKSDLKNATGVHTSDFAKKSDLPSLKSDVDKLEIDKLKNVPSGLNIFKSKIDKLYIGELETLPFCLSKLKRMNMMNWLKKLTILRLLIIVIWSKKLTITQKFIEKKLKRKLMIMITVISILLLKNVIGRW